MDYGKKAAEKVVLLFIVLEIMPRLSECTEGAGLSFYLCHLYTTIMESEHALIGNNEGPFSRGDGKGHLQNTAGSFSVEPGGMAQIGSAADLPHPADRRMYRFFEILPGALAWGTFAGVVAASWFSPFLASVFIIAFDCYWLIKTIFLSMHLRAGYTEMKKRMGINW